MFTVWYIISQILAVVALVFLSITFFTKKDSVIVVCSIFAAVAFALEYALLGEWAGVAMNGISAVGNVWFYIYNRKGKPRSKTSIVVILSAIILCGIYNTGVFNGLVPTWYSFVSIFAEILFIYAVWQPKILWYRWLGTISNILWVVYNIFCFSIAGMVVELVLLVIAVTGLVKYYVDKNKEKKCDS